MTHSLKLKKPLAFFDLESTGINTNQDRIVEISILKAMPDGETQTRTWRINPEMKIPFETTLIHGISDEDVANEPTFKKAGQEIARFLDGCDLAGYNSVKFDLPMLVEEFMRCDIEFDFSKRRMVDAQKIFHYMEPRNLAAAYKFYCGRDMDEDGRAHSADFDTLVTFKVLEEQVKRYEGQSRKDEKGNSFFPVQNDVEVLDKLSRGNQFDLAGRMVYDEKGNVVFNFGKHKGKVVTDVFRQEPSYYDWMMRGDFARDTKRRLTDLKLSMSGLLQK
ncbi:MAG TPA: exonuclease domain-containing protein [Catalimonadaceae bacterium]|jgi:DNA polymerase-3 subunit epsilon|nr:exonuclease domain-containing protein [Catalimonadaceae bacterium]